jgi:hypothetical protein
MMRLATIFAVERGIRVCTIVHDAFLIEAPIDRIEEAVQAMQDCMREASRAVLNGFELRSDAHIYHHPNRFMDERGARMWQRVIETLSELQELKEGRL